jgi:ABC-type transport system involved in multi-copper enzyme maturation permease subunit
VAETVTPGFLKRLFMNPLAVRELRVACRSWRLVAFLSAYLLIQCSIVSIWAFTASDAGVYSNPTSIGLGLFITLSVVLVLTVMMVFPAFSSTAIAGEHERKSFDLLLLTPLEPWEIALGKFFAAALQASVFLIATVPLYATIHLFGGIETAVFFMVLWVLVLLSVLISFVGVFASSLVKRSIPAVLVTYALAFVLGILLLVVFTVLQIGLDLAARFMPLASFFDQPTMGEGLFYIAMLTVTCGLYCTFLFFATTNRLKPTARNRSTNLRIFWVCAMVVVPLQVAAYFVFIDVPSPQWAFGTLMVGILYLCALLLVPVLTAPAEPPLASRRVRRELERVPAALRKLGAGMFFPGGARGALHTSCLIVLGLGLMALVAWHLSAVQVGQVTDPETMALAMSELRLSESSIHAILADEPTREMFAAVLVEAVQSIFRGTLLLILTLGLTLLLVCQLVWRMSLSGLSRGVTPVMTVLLLGGWLVGPYLLEWAGRGDPGATTSKVAHFSPLHAGLQAVTLSPPDRESLPEMLQRGTAETEAAKLDARRKRWNTFMGTVIVAGTVLLVLNVRTHRKILRVARQLLESPATGPPEPQGPGS